MNQDLVFQLAGLLQSTFTAHSASERLQNEQLLGALAEDLECYFQALMGIIQAPDFAPQVKSAAAINLRQFIRHKTEAAAISQTHREIIVISILNALSLESLEKPIRESLGNAISPFFTASSDIAKLAQIVSPQLVTQLQNEQLILGACCALRVIFNGLNDNIGLFNLFQNVQGNLVAAGLKTLQELQGLSGVTLALRAEEKLFEISSVITAIIEHFQLTERAYFSEFKEL